EMRRVMTREEVEANLEAQKAQLARYLDLEPKPTKSDPAKSEQSTRGFVLNNADWLLGLGYIEFLRDVGRHFSVNRMLAQESVKLRLESEAGLPFLEFN